MRPQLDASDPKKSQSILRLVQESPRFTVGSTSNPQLLANPCGGGLSVAMILD